MLCDNRYLHVSAHVERLLLLDQWVHIHHVRRLCKAVITQDKRQVHLSFVDGCIHHLVFLLAKMLVLHRHAALTAISTTATSSDDLDSRD